MSEETLYDLWVQDLNRKLADFQNTAKDENRKPSSTKTSGPLNVRRSSACQSGNSSEGINVENKSVETPEFSSNTDKSENLKGEKKSRRAAKRPKNEKYLAEKRRKKREKQQRYREAVKNDPVRYEASKQYERARNEERKKSGKLKAVTDLKPREKRAQQKNWRENSKRYRSVYFE